MTVAVARVGCAVCRRPIPVNQPRYLLDPEGSEVCRDCCAGYRLCEHGYIREGWCEPCKGGSNGSTGA